MKIVWSHVAIISLREIYNFYKENVSQKVASNIRDNILRSVSILKKQPYIGKNESFNTNNDKSYLVIISGIYKIYYNINQNNIEVLVVFDNRQNPAQLLKILNINNK